MGKRKGQVAVMSQSILLKDRNKKHGPRKDGNDSFLHTTELDDGTTYNRINFQSVTEQSNLEDFLTTAELAGKDFTADRQNIQIINNPGVGVRLTNEDMQKITLAQHAHRALLQIPRRPKWHESTTKEELVLMERDSFTNWRRQLKLLEEKEHIQLTPYEKNLDFWRQLWRVIERSDIIVQIVDARNPLLFRCEDLEVYVKEVDPRKAVMLLINKADFLTLQQRQQWVDYFNKEGIRVVFFSAKVEKEKQEEIPEATESPLSKHDDEDYDDVSDEDSQSHSDTDSNPDNDDNHNDGDSNAENEDEGDIQSIKNSDIIGTASSSVNHTPVTEHGDSITTKEHLMTPEINFVNSAEIISVESLLDIFRKLSHPVSHDRSDDIKTVGMVGYPNVGKSSTINVLLNKKRLAVSATPGRTKHLQTLFVDQTLMLCDCPGLVFPSFVATKAHLVINGILPIDELRDHISPISLVCDRIPRHVLEATYSIMIPRPSLDDNPDRAVTAEELLHSYGAMRGFMTQRGLPDGPRASRYILKDYVKGRLLYCEPPPGVDAAEFQDKERIAVLEEMRPISKIPPPQIRSDVDKEFFTEKHSRIHYRGKGNLSEIVGASSNQRGVAGSTAAASLTGSMSSVNTLQDKPWKKHNNRNKKEKLRRLHRDLDV